MLIDEENWQKRQQQERRKNRIDKKRKNTRTKMHSIHFPIQMQIHNEKRPFFSILLKVSHAHIYFLFPSHIRPQIHRSLWWNLHKMEAIYKQHAALLYILHLNSMVISASIGVCVRLARRKVSLLWKLSNFSLLVMNGVLFFFARFTLFLHLALAIPFVGLSQKYARILLTHHMRPRIHTMLYWTGIHCEFVRV